MKSQTSPIEKWRQCLLLVQLKSIPVAGDLCLCRVEDSDKMRINGW